MTVRDIYDSIDSFAPFASQAEWDNSGLLIGDINAEVNKAIICLDVTMNELDFAIKNDAQLIISHHPVIFKSRKNFLSTDVAFVAAKNSINIISAHTNLDKAVNGVNDTLCRFISKKFEKIPEPVCDGFLNICYPESIMSRDEFAELLKTRLGCHINYCKGNSAVSKIGVCCGSGSDFITDAKALGCDAFITGEATYHSFLDADACGIALFTAGHYETEIPVIPELTKLLKKQFTNTEFIEFISLPPIKTVM